MLDPNFREVEQIEIVFLNCLDEAPLQVIVIPGGELLKQSVAFFLHS